MPDLTVLPAETSRDRFWHITMKVKGVCQRSCWPLWHSSLMTKVSRRVAGENTCTTDKAIGLMGKRRARVLKIQLKLYLNRYFVRLGSFIRIGA